MFTFLARCTNILQWLFLIYFLMQAFQIGPKIVSKVMPYAEKILTPVRELMYKMIPASKNSNIDYTPIAVFVLLWLATAIFNVLGGVR